MTNRAERVVPVEPTILCRAFGETDLPVVRIVNTREEVAQFFCEEWFGEQPETMHPSNRAQFDDAMERFNAPADDPDSWDGGNEIEWTFEIGGITLTKVYVSAAPELSEEAVRKIAERYAGITVGVYYPLHRRQMITGAIRAALAQTAPAHGGQAINATDSQDSPAVERVQGAAPTCNCTLYNGMQCYNCLNGAHNICAGDGCVTFGDAAAHRPGDGGTSAGDAGGQVASDQKLCSYDRKPCPAPAEGRGRGNSRCEQNGVCQRVNMNDLPTIEIKLDAPAPATSPPAASEVDGSIQRLCEGYSPADCKICAHDSVSSIRCGRGDCQWERNDILAVVDALEALRRERDEFKSERDQAQGELRQIDYLLARRDALDGIERRFDKIAYALKSAGEYHSKKIVAERRAEAAESALAREPELERDRYIRAFSAGADWLRWETTGATSFPSERDQAEIAASKKFESIRKLGDAT